MFSVLIEHPLMVIGLDVHAKRVLQEKEKAKIKSL